MAEAVTYADLRFVKGLREKSQPARAPQEEESEGDLTYENVQVSRPREGETPRSAGDVQEGDQRTRFAALALFGVCLFLLVTAIGLGVRYWQVSRQLRRASQAHAMESSALNQTIDAKEGSLAESQQLLRKVEAELSSTRRALAEEWMAWNRTLEQQEEELRRAKSSLAALMQEKEEEQQERQKTEGKLNETERQLRQARSCRQTGCCPPDWKLFRCRCLWVSTSQENWEDSLADCNGRLSQLLILKEPLDARGLRDAAIITQGTNYWIGLRKQWQTWHWVDTSLYEGDETSLFTRNTRYALCATLNENGGLSDFYCSTRHRYICERAASPAQPGPVRGGQP